MVCLVVSILLTSAAAAQTPGSTPEGRRPESVDGTAGADPISTELSTPTADPTPDDDGEPPEEAIGAPVVEEAVDATTAKDEESWEIVEKHFVLALDGKRTPLSQSPVAVTVLTGEDLRSMGVPTLAEAFRYVPEMDVFQLNGFTYAAGIRGVDDEFNPRFQVYLDGRLVNVAEYGGVDWESLPVSIEDIERVEIIRGAGIPGESGSALNGAVRIYTLKPVDVPLLTA